VKFIKTFNDKHNLQSTAASRPLQHTTLKTEQSISRSDVTNVAFLDFCSRFLTTLLAEWSSNVGIEIDYITRCSWVSGMSKEGKWRPLSGVRLLKFKMLQHLWPCLLHETTTWLGITVTTSTVGPSISHESQMSLMCLTCTLRCLLPEHNFHKVFFLWNLHPSLS
jgi:hypothetical protein